MSWWYRGTSLIRNSAPGSNVMDRIGAGPPLARTEVIYVDRILGYFGLDPPRRGSGLVGNKHISAQKCSVRTRSWTGPPEGKGLQW